MSGRFNSTIQVGDKKIAKRNDIRGGAKRVLKHLQNFCEHPLCGCSQKYENT